MTGWGENLLNTLAEHEQLKAENARLRGNLEAIKKILDDSRVKNRPLSVYDAAEIYAECFDALNGGKK